MDRRPERGAGSAATGSPWPMTSPDEVAGDFYDLLPSAGTEPGTVPADLNTVPYQEYLDDTHRYCTVVFGPLDPAGPGGRTATLARGGHPPALLLRAGGTAACRSVPPRPRRPAACQTKPADRSRATACRTPQACSGAAASRH